ncbi:MAG: type III-A CRISPR-associated RAMP protein Csm5 [Thermodesulfobacteriota bacterium]|nr:type III-A CRISPR-associated RAMP protein Csm5 [Thermodesulfobacteriota bacterium]
MEQLKSCRVNLNILSPVHIGSGQELDPFLYMIRDEKLLLIDLLQWMEGYDDKESLHEKMDSDNFVALRAFIADNFNNENAVINTIPVESHEVVEAYRKAIQETSSHKQALINFMTRNEITSIPYIPGSSIKGAIRTAIANRFVEIAKVSSKNSKKQYKPHYEPDYNEKIFGNPTNDPMKNLKISDVSLDIFGTVIYEAREHTTRDKNTPKNAYEAAVSLCHINEDVIYPLHFSHKPFILHGETIDLKFIVDSLYQFYVPKFKKEYSKFFSNSRHKDIQRSIAKMNSKIIQLKTNEALIRIGHFSHVECVTLDEVRRPITRKGKDGKQLPWGTTRTLANGIYPFGWAKLEFLDLEQQPRAENEWPFTIEEIERLVIDREALIKNEKAFAEAAARSTKAEEKRKKELEAMSPEERAIEEIKDPSTSPNRIFEIYNELDKCSEEGKKRIALALKDYWQLHNNWQKKDCSKKQQIKVQNMKEILGEK